MVLESLLTAVVVFIIWKFVTRNGPSLTNELNNKFNSATAATAPSASSNRGIGFDSESDEDGDLFGSTKPSRDLFGDSQAVKTDRRDSGSHRSNSSSSISRTGVENVRAMPNPTKVKIPQAKRPLPPKSDFFASESDEDDLFSSKSRSSSRVSNSSNKLLPPAQAPTNKGSSGLFSSDGEDEDGGLFGAQTAVPHGDGTPAEETTKESLVSKSSRSKVPVGGVNIFGSAITSALRKQQMPDTDQSEGSDWEDNEKAPPPVKKKEVPDSDNLFSKKQDPSPASHSVTQVTTAGKSAVGHNLFDDDDDDDLFGVTSKRNVSISKQSPSTSTGVVEKKTKEKGPQGSITNIKSSQPESKTSLGLFSDDDDDLFSIPVAKESKPSTIPVSLPYSESPSSQKLGGTKNLGEMPSDVSKKNITTPAINVPVEKTPQPSSLFSSPSDDDLFSPSKIPKTKSVPVVITEPPPLPPAKSGESVNDIFGSPSSDENLFDPPASVTSKPKLKSEKITAVQPGGGSGLVENVKEKPPPSLTKSLFSSPSDDDDLFSTAPVVVKTAVRKSDAPESNSGSLTEAKEDKISSNEVNRIQEKSGDNYQKSSEVTASKQLGSVNKDTSLIPPKLESKPKLNLFASTEEDDEDIFFGFDSKTSTQSKTTSVVQGIKNENEGLFDSPDSDDDIFTTIPKSTNKDQENSKPFHEEGDKDILKSVESQCQENTLSETEKTLIPPPVNDRESPPPLPQSASSNHRFEQVNETISKTKAQCPQKPEEDSVLEVNKQKPPKDENKANQETSKENELPKDDIFGLEDSDDDYLFKNAHISPKKSVSLVNQTSPPPFPEEAEVVPKSNQKPNVTESKISSTKPEQTQEKIVSDGTRDVKPPKELNGNSVEKIAEKDVNEDKETEILAEEKPKKKPPVGGVSLFGGGGLGGSELFAKVKQRKSMLAASDSDEEEVDNTPSLPGSKLKEENVSNSGSSASTSETFSPVSPLSPVMPNALPVNNTDCEAGVSFEDPITSNTVLQSINKTRAKGNKQRRPPSRAHRKGVNTNVKSVIASVPPVDVHSGLVNNVEKYKSSETKNETASKPAITSKENKVVDSIETVSGVVEKNKIKRNTEKNEDTSRPSTTHPLKNTNALGGIVEDDDDLFSNPKTKSSARGKKSNPPHTSSLFGESNSDDDEDLFGASKSRSASSASAKVKASQSDVISGTAKPSAQALFGDDDDDDIFSSSGVDTKPPSNLQKTASVVKPRSTLKPSSEPFEDPLLGNLK
ncbi:WASH complex subunit 2-like isoform X2 [Macrobrachium nipponense]|uniref:WASH complex subunit 2-like isoform X2 n=1 Tax=Macrobrachium nipponense TaxID=159736 RepID=UPI0030C7D00F